jgi:hypothetical protein
MDSSSSVVTDLKSNLDQCMIHGLHGPVIVNAVLIMVEKLRSVLETEKALSDQAQDHIRGLETEKALSDQALAAAQDHIRVLETEKALSDQSLAASKRARLVEKSLSYQALAAERVLSDQALANGRDLLVQVLDSAEQDILDEKALSDQALAAERTHSFQALLAEQVRFAQALVSAEQARLVEKALSDQALVDAQVQSLADQTCIQDLEETLGLVHDRYFLFQVLADAKGQSIDEQQQDVAKQICYIDAQRRLLDQQDSPEPFGSPLNPSVPL